MRIKYLLVLVSNILIISIAVTFSAFLYKTHNGALLEGIDNKLLTAAYCIEDILPKNYHDRIVNKNSVPMNEYLGIVDRYNKLCIKLGLQYMWSLMIINDQIVFTSGTSTGKDVTKGDHALFFDVHTSPNAYKEAFSTMNIQHSTFHDQWGDGRMVLVPKYDSKGRRYLLAASMSINDVKTMVGKTILHSLVISMIVLSVGLILSFLLSSFLSKPLIRLTEIAENIAGGNLNQKIEMRGSLELRNLSKSIEAMSNSIHDKIEEIENKNKVLTKEIVERRQAEEALRESESRFKDLASFLPLSLFETDDQGNVTYANHFAFESTGYTQEDIDKGFTMLQVIHPKDQDRAIKMSMQVMQGLHTDGSEYLAQRKDGSTFPAFINTRASIKDDKPAGLKGYIFNLTEQKMAEEALRESEEKLRQAQKMESIGTLAGGIAHDFNNVLYSIIGYTELTMDDVPEDSMAQKNLKEVFKGAMRAKDMVQQILAFSRKADTQKKPIKVQSVVKEAIKLLKTSIPSTIEIRHNIDEDCGPVMADSTQIHQVVMNLATNAYQAMREKGGVLELTLMGEEISSDDSDPDLGPGTYLKLTVSDTGHGIDNVVIEKIFDPYFTTKSPGESTGMGLAVVHGIVKDHGGNIEVYSKLGEGTTFSVYLPLVETRPFEPETVSVVPILTGTERILFVDDEEAIVFMTQQTLERLGYQVTPRTSSVEALELFRAKPDDFDLVITDMTMPNMTGVKLTSRLKEIRADIPIIICTGFSEVIDKNRAKALGMSEYVMKPIVKEEIAGTIRKVLDVGREK